MRGWRLRGQLVCGDTEGTWVWSSSSSSAVGSLFLRSPQGGWRQGCSQLREHEGKGRESGKMNYAPARTIKLSWVLRAPHYSFINFVDIVEGGNGEWVVEPKKLKWRTKIPRKRESKQYPVVKSSDCALINSNWGESIRRCNRAIADHDEETGKERSRRRRPMWPLIWWSTDNTVQTGVEKKGDGRGQNDNWMNKLIIGN